VKKGKRFLSWLLLAGGLLLLVSGSREFIESISSQEEVAEQWRQEVESRASSQPAETIAPRFDKGDFIARLSIPRLGAELYVVEGAGKSELRRGPGHLTGTAFPGESDNSIIAGHRDTHFRVLKDIRAGDDIVIEYRGEHLVYRVRDTKVVKPTSKKVLAPSDDPTLTLITCYPFYWMGPAPKRFVVQADLTNRVSLETAGSGGAMGRKASLAP
jgi:sortase A